MWKQENIEAKKMQKQKNVETNKCGNKQMQKQKNKEVKNVETKKCKNEKILSYMCLICVEAKK